EGALVRPGFAIGPAAAALAVRRLAGGLPPVLTLALVDGRPRVVSRERVLRGLPGAVLGLLPALAGDRVVTVVVAVLVPVGPGRPRVLARPAEARATRVDLVVTGRVGARARAASARRGATPTVAGATAPFAGGLVLVVGLA